MKEKFFTKPTILQGGNCMKNIRNLLISLCLLQFACSAIAKNFPSDNIVLDLQFNEGKGEKTVDNSPLEATCLLIDKPEWVPGYSEYAVKFLKKSQYIQIRHNKKLNLQKFTFECWLKPSNVDNYHKLRQGILWGPDTDLWKKGFGIQLNCGTLSVIMNCGEKRSKVYNSKNSNGFLPLIDGRIYQLLMMEVI